jgi:hypothetical protein
MFVTQQTKEFNSPLNFNVQKLTVIEWNCKNRWWWWWRRDDNPQSSKFLLGTDYGQIRNGLTQLHSIITPPLVKVNLENT